MSFPVANEVQVLTVITLRWLINIIVVNADCDSLLGAIDCLVSGHHFITEQIDYRSFLE
jgi:hypothetical protein